MAPKKNVFGLIEKINSADITVYQHRCVAVRNRNASCRKCAEACTSGAISIQINELTITPDKCIGCGTCATVCPTCALEAHRPNDAELLRSVQAAVRANDGVAVLACHQIVDAAGAAVDGEKIVGVECLGRVEESLITGLAAHGCKQVLMVKGRCAECDHAVGLTTAEAVRDTANELLECWDCPMRAEIVDRFPGSVRALAKGGFDESRRNFFFKAKDNVLAAANLVASEAIDDALDVEAIEPPKYLKVMDDGTLPHFLPNRRERLLDNLAELGEPKEQLLVTRLWGHVVIDPQVCNSCRMCATFCPTGAIAKFDDPDGTIGIDHYPGDCVKCRCCEDVCPTKALRLYDEVLAEDLLSGGVERCVMNPPKYDYSSSKRTRTMFRDVLNCPDIYDR